jgi:hypothetical protein
VILIAAGVVLLLNNLGLLGWDVWGALARLWPVLLIAAGLDLLVGRRSALLSLLIGLAALAALAGGAWYLGVRPGALAAASSEPVDYALQGAERADVDLSLNAGEVRVSALNAPGALANGMIYLGRGERLERDFAVRGGEAHLRLHAAGPPNMSFGPADTAQPWDLRLSREVPTRLRVSTGAGRAVLDLSQIQLTSLEVSAGVGATELMLPARGRITASISAGVGETVVRVPVRMAARIHASGGLGDVSVDSRFAREGEYYTTPGYDTASDRVDLEISSGVGAIRVETLP